MENIKKILIILIAITLALIATIVTIFVMSFGKEKENTLQNNTINNNIQQNTINSITENEEINIGVVKLKDANTFFSIERMIKNYFLYLRVGNANGVYELLDLNFIEKHMINKEQVLEILRTGEPYDGTYEVKEIYTIEDDITPVYYIYGTLEKNLTKTPYYLIMYVDLQNSSYSLKVINENEYINYITNQEIETGHSIESNNYNKLQNTKITNEELAKKYFESYIHNARYYPEEAYNSLEENYRNQKFGSFENYKVYLSNKSEELQSLDYTDIKSQSEFNSEEEYTNYLNNLNKKGITRYAIATKDGIKYCACVDEYNNYYIFQILDVMNYKLVLDKDNIDLSEILD